MRKMAFFAHKKITKTALNVIKPYVMRAWRNGRRTRLKILGPIGRVGSSPTVRTTSL